MRSGTSIGANVTEALCGISKKDFLSKMYIAFKESAESLYWIELLFRTDYITTTEYDDYKSDCQELKKMLSKITKTTNDELSNRKR